MRCPRCRCEVGSQKMCPYCGAPMQVSEQLLSAQGATTLNKIYRYIRSMDSIAREQSRKLNILLVLACGNMAMMLLVLIALFLM